MKLKANLKISEQHCTQDLTTSDLVLSDISSITCLSYLLYTYAANWTVKRFIGGCILHVLELSVALGA